MDGMADTDVLQAIRIIDDKIASLQEARNRLASAFGVDDNPLNQAFRNRARVVAQTTAIIGPSHARNGHAEAPPMGRKEQLAQFLLENGPMSRVNLIARAGIPEGTISYCLNDKNFFEQTENGDWMLTDFSRRGLERRGIVSPAHGD